MKGGGERGWAAFVVTAMSALVMLLLWTLLVVEPAQTVSDDLGSLYAAMGVHGWLSMAVLGGLWLGAVGAVTVVTVVVGSAGQRAAGSSGLLLRRVTAATGGIGLVAAVSVVVPGTQVRLGWYLLAEQLGTAPPTGSMSDLLVGIFVTGCGLLAVAVVGVVTMAVCARRWRRLRQF